MDGLKALDHVAYIRFASVYKDFSEPGDFAEIAERSERKPRRPATTSCCERGAKPVIVLVRPQLGQNIGKAARAMLNFGLTEMRLVAPRDGWPNPDAGPGGERRRRRARAGAGLRHGRRGGRRLLDRLRLDGAPPRPRHAGRRPGARWPTRSPPRAERSAILFGPERSGLETEEVALADAIVTVPINPEFASLNLAQAVILLAYEWSKRREPCAAAGQGRSSRPRRTASSKG